MDGETASSTGTDAPDTNADRGYPRLWAVAVAIVLTVAALALSTVLTLVTAGLLMVTLDLSLEEVFATSSTVVFATLLIATQLGFLLTGLAYTWARSFSVPIAVPDGRDLLYAVGGALVALVAAGALLYVADLLGVTPEAVLDEEVALNEEVLIVLAVLSILIVAPAEEYLFRGVVQGRLRTVMGPVGAIVGASLVFGGMHAFNYVGLQSVVVGVLLISSVSLVFGYIYEQTDNLTVPVVAHAVYNVILAAGTYVAL
ncbi:CPBP family intramembrane glutamic endopeptidase [Natronobiforma cellulositropha]|uniref:CPBP family intramembrane glutamic endopeptidase n=1 Tax=Natronobiforma cellulositropha TaxID=1679076 RepID=UPI0021D5AF7E|nr:CPBP family intramembrane glutamic endopeptidase [Natronobiforma cellulositropha]